MWHKTKSGEVMRITDMEDTHLWNTIHLIERLARNGIVLREGGGFDSYEIWYEEWELKGEEALEHLRYYEYLKEYKKRGLGFDDESEG